MHSLENRQCKCCKQAKPISDFYCWNAEKGWYAWRCSTCEKERKNKGYRRISSTKKTLPQDFTCIRCKINKPISEYWPRKGTKSGHYKTCTTCESDAQLKKRYGITLADKQQMYIEQEGKCAICNRKFVIEELVVDHCHSDAVATKESVRGLLCSSCNRAIGLLGESVYLYKNAANYLLRHYFKGDPPTITASVPVVRKEIK